MALGVGCGRERERRERRGRDREREAERERQEAPRALGPTPSAQTPCRVGGNVIKKRRDQVAFRRGPRALRALDPADAFGVHHHLGRPRPASQAADGVLGVVRQIFGRPPPAVVDAVFDGAGGRRARGDALARTARSAVPPTEGGWAPTGGGWSHPPTEGGWDHRGRPLSPERGCPRPSPRPCLPRLAGSGRADRWRPLVSFLPAKGRARDAPSADGDAPLREGAHLHGEGGGGQGRRGLSLSLPPNAPHKARRGALWLGFHRTVSRPNTATQATLTLATGPSDRRMSPR